MGKPNELPTVAVVLPILNEADSLVELINMSGKLHVDEVLFVDGGSTDASIALLESANVSWISSEKGRAVQMNAGAAQVKSDMMVFLHADTIITQKHISSIKQHGSDQAVVGGRFDVRLSGDSVAFRVIEWMINVRSRLTKISTGDQVMFVRRRVFEAMGGFADIPLMEDVEFSKRLKTMGEVVCLREKVETSSRRWEKHGVISTVWLMWKLRLLFWLGVDPIKLKQRYVNHQSVDHH